MDLVQGASNILNMCKGLGHIIEICLCCVADLLVLPVGESVGKTSPCQLEELDLSFRLTSGQDRL